MHSSNLARHSPNQRLPPHRSWSHTEDAADGGSRQTGRLKADGRSRGGAQLLCVLYEAVAGAVADGHDVGRVAAHRAAFVPHRGRAHPDDEVVSVQVGRVKYSCLGKDSTVELTRLLEDVALKRFITRCA